MSDKVFKGARTPAGVVFLLGVAGAISIYWLVDGPLWIACVTLALTGGLIYGPVMLIGLQAIDLLRPGRQGGEAPDGRAPGGQRSRLTGLKR